MLERETARSRSAQEQFLVVTLSGLDEARAALRGSQAERAALAERFHVTAGHNRRLAAHNAALAADMRARTAEAEERRERSAALAASNLQVRAVTARVGGLEARFAEAEAAASRREEDLRSVRARSRWIRLGRPLGLTRL